MQLALNYRLQHTIPEHYSEHLGCKYFLARLLVYNREKTKQKPHYLFKIILEISLFGGYLQKILPVGM